MAEEHGRTDSRWGTAVALAVALLVFSVAHALVLLILPAAVLVAVFSTQRWRAALLTAPLAVLVLLPSGDAMLALSQGWAALVAASFVSVTFAYQRWPVLDRGLAAVGGAGVLALAWFAGSGTAPAVDALLLAHFDAATDLTLRQLARTSSASAPAADVAAIAAQVAGLQWMLFPAVLALQSLAALALATWFAKRTSARDRTGPPLGRLREFRFNDHLVWLVIGGLVVVAMPLQPGLTRIGWNLLFAMGALYALRGVGVFAFFSKRAPSFLSVLFGTVAALLFYPFILATVLLIGLGDTWLDVRARAIAASRA